VFRVLGELTAQGFRGFAGQRGQILVSVHLAGQGVSGVSRALEMGVAMSASLSSFILKLAPSKTLDKPES
jgi:hypothetical protein